MKRAMTRYRPDDLPVTCAECGGRLRWVADRFAWQHTVKGADHAPRPAGSVAS